MKKAFTLLAALIVFFVAVWSALHNKEVFAARVSEPRGQTTIGADSLQQMILAKEREGLDALKSGNLDVFANLTAEEAVFVDAAGPAGKADVMKNVAGFKLTEYAIEDVRFVRLSDASGLISYKIAEKGVSHGHEFAAQVYVSSIWAERGGKWACLFSQETAARRPAKQPS
jgi:Domain of unknown function (DUF4440)